MKKMITVFRNLENRVTKFEKGWNTHSVQEVLKQLATNPILCNQHVRICNENGWKEYVEDRWQHIPDEILTITARRYRASSKTCVVCHCTINISCFEENGMNVDMSSIGMLILEKEKGEWKIGTLFF
ncbi:MAG: hypothetical protein Q8P11_03225 [bacterium]|nr:hypothetical protein [bacterium]